METDTAHMEPAKEKANEPLPRTTCSPSSTPEMDAAAQRAEAFPRTIGKWVEP